MIHQSCASDAKSSADPQLPQISNGYVKIVSCGNRGFDRKRRLYDSFHFAFFRHDRHGRSETLPLTKMEISGDLRRSITLPWFVDRVSFPEYKSCPKRVSKMTNFVRSMSLARWEYRETLTQKPRFLSRFPVLPCSTSRIATRRTLRQDTTIMRITHSQCLVDVLRHES